MNLMMTRGFLLAAGVLLAGCDTTGMPWKSSSPAASDEKSAVKSENTKTDSSKPKVITDSTKVVEGEGRKVKGIGDWEGEISGVPVAGSKFNKLQIGMTMRQSMDLIGNPSDEGAYMTGKAWIPFYFGSDRHRYEMVYKNTGRLIFAGGGMGDYTSGHLIWIIHNANEPGYR